MAYSRKRYWLALGAGLAVIAAFLVLVPPLNLAPAGVKAIQMAVAAACGVLGFLAYFSLDEIQRQNEMRAWYYGGPVAIMIILVPIMLLGSNAMLETMAGFLPDASRIVTELQYSPKVYVSLGMMMTLVVQMLGYSIARAIFSAVERAR